MKDLIKTFIKYVLIFILSFLFIFLIIILFHIFPAIKLSGGDNNKIINLIGALGVPCFYYSLYNSLLISVFIFGVLVLNYQKKNKLIVFFIPIVLSSILVFAVLFYFKPSSGMLNFNRIDDARLYFSAKNFFENDEKKFYFESVEKNKIKKAIITDKKNVNFYQELNITFLEDKILVNLPQKEQPDNIKFEKKQLHFYNINSSFLTINFFKSLNNITHRLVEQKNIIINLALWISIVFLILSFTVLIKIINYPLLSLVINFIFFIFFYYFFNILFDIYHKIFIDLLATSVFRDLLLSIIFFIIGLMLLAMNFIFSKSSLNREK